jgi:hypothetical protein
VDDRWIDSLIVWQRDAGGLSLDALDRKALTTLICHIVRSLMLQRRTHFVQKIGPLREEFFAMIWRDAELATTL